MKTITIQIPDDCDIKIIKRKEKKEVIIRTYQDLIDNDIKIKGYIIDGHSCINSVHKTCACYLDKRIAASEKVAKSMLAMAMISQLMPFYGGEICDAEWADSRIEKYILYRDGSNTIFKNSVFYNYYFLAFHTSEQRDNFLKYNEQLVKDYLMLD